MFRLYIYSFPLLGSISNTLCTFMCGTPFLAAFNVPRIAVFAAVVNMAFVAYLARRDPIMSTIPNPPVLCSGLKGRRPFWLLNPQARGGGGVLACCCLRFPFLEMRRWSRAQILHIHIFSLQNVYSSIQS